MADAVLNLAPVNPTPTPAPVTLPTGQTLVPEGSAPQSIADAIKAAREARATPAAPTATDLEEVPTDPETPAPADGATDGSEGGEEETEGAEAKGGEEVAGDDVDDVDDALVIELPARTPNGEPLRIVAPDQETAEAFQRLHNGYMRGEQAREVQAQSREVIEEFEEFRESLTLDPLSVIESALSVDQAEMLARSLLANPAIQQRLFAELEGLLGEDEGARERFALKAKNQRAELRDAARTQIDDQRAARANARDVNAAIGRLVPPSYSDEQREFFFRDAIGDIQHYQRRTGQRLIAPNTVAQILAPRLKALGLDSAARRDRTPARAPAIRATPAAASAPAGNSPVRVARTVDVVKANAEKRQLAGAAAPGATTVSRQTPLDQIDKSSSVQDAIRQYRKIRRAG